MREGREGEGVEGGGMAGVRRFFSHNFVFGGAGSWSWFDSWPDQHSGS
jgi:hypothetical protein